MEFRHQPLDPTKPSIRLLTVLSAVVESGMVECRIQHDLVNTARYKAISYMWGNPEGDQYAIKINGEIFRVRRNLYGFLRYAQIHLFEQNLWIDAICIDQNNIAERNHQVQQMSQIYTNGSSVCVWLGNFLAQPEAFCMSFRRPGSLTKSLLRASTSVRQLYIKRSIRLAYEKYYDGKHVAHKALDAVQTFWEDMSLVLNNEYWSRLWIMQELALARSLLFIFNDFNLTGEAFYKRLEMLALNVESVAQSYAILESPAYVFAKRHLQSIKALQAQAGVWTGPVAETKESFVWAMQASKRAQCLDPRDKVFGILSFVDTSGPEFEVDYNLDVQGLFYRVLTHFQHEFSEEMALQVMEALNIQPLDFLHGSTKHRAAVYRVETDSKDNACNDNDDKQDIKRSERRFADELRCHTCFHLIQEPRWPPRQPTGPSHLVEGDVFSCIGVPCRWKSRALLHLAFRQTYVDTEYAVVCFEGVRPLAYGEHQADRRAYHWEKKENSSLS